VRPFRNADYVARVMANLERVKAAKARTRTATPQGDGDMGEANLD
jgi:hypothetical protein